MNNVIEFTLVTPTGLETDSNGKPVVRTGRLPNKLNKADVHIRDLIVVSDADDHPFEMGIITNKNGNHENEKIPLIIIVPNQQDSLMKLVRRYGLQTGRSKVIQEKSYEKD